jgi:hypothetical protein
MRDKLKVVFFAAYFLLAPLAAYYWPHPYQWTALHASDAGNAPLRLTVGGKVIPDPWTGLKLEPGATVLFGIKVDGIKVYIPAGSTLQIQRGWK